MSISQNQTADYLAVVDKVLSYGNAIDCNDFEALAALFTEKTIFSVPDLEPVIGADAIVTSIRRATATRAWQQHFISICHVRFTSPQRAEVVSNLISHKTFKDKLDQVIMLCGRYIDELECIDGDWWICAKRLELGWTETRARPAI